MIVVGLVPPSQAVRVEIGAWNTFLFFLGLMLIAALADQSGAFDAVAFQAARLAGGSVLRLYLWLFGLGAVIALFFTNDAAALVLTPIVYALVLRLSLDPLPFVFLTTFIADTASVGLPSGNPLNVIVSGALHLSLGEYVAHLWLPALLVIAINAGVFVILFRRRLRGRFGAIPPAPPVAPSVLVILAAIGVGYLVAAATQFYLGIVAVIGAGLLALVLARLGRLDLPRLGGDLSWAIFGFLAGIYVLVQGLDDSGATHALGRAIVDLSAGSPIRTIAVGIAGTALGANLINNLPAALVMVATLPHAHLAAPLRTDLAYATILGADLGPNLTHLGSLATFLWLLFLRRRGMDVSAWDYFRIGVIVTPLLIAGAILGLGVTSGAMRW